MLEDATLYYASGKRHFILDTSFARILVDIGLVMVLVSNSFAKSINRS